MGLGAPILNPRFQRLQNHRKQLLRKRTRKGEEGMRKQG
jgi:hypothetical protein